MPSITDLTDFLLYKEPNRAANWLHLVDVYIRSFNDAPNQFVLPREHAILLPAIEGFAYNLGGFLAYVRGVRDSFPARSEEYLPLHDLYRKLSGRYVQQIRRERIGRALKRAIELHGEAPTDIKARWVIRLERLWAQRRLAYLQSWRTSQKTKRLTHEEQAEALNEFWETIEQEIIDGERIPKWE